MEGKKLRLKRAFLHVLAGVIILALIYYYEYANWLLFFTLILGIILSLLSTLTKIPIVNFLIETCELGRHKKEFPGKSSLFFLAGSLIVLKLFSQDIALASIAILTFADPISYFASGIRKVKYPKPFNTDKSIIGTFIAILVAFISASFFISWKYALLAGFFSMLAEALIIKVWEDHIDDNFIIPLVAGTTVYIARIFF